MRYCYDTEKNTRFKTLELIVEETPFQAAVSDSYDDSPPQAAPYVGLKVELEEKTVLDSIRKMGASGHLRIVSAMRLDFICGALVYLSGL